MQGMKRAIYFILFEDNSVYVGLTKNPMRRYWEHLDSVSLGKKLHSYDHEFFNLNRFYNEGYAAIVEKNLIQKFKDDGFILLNKDSGGGLGGKRRKFSIEQIKSKAKKYKTKKNFIKYAYDYYRAARTKKILNKCCEHMSDKHYILRFNKGYWTEKRIFAEAKKYKTKKSFMRGTPSAYHKSKKMGIFDKCTKHMKVFSKPANYWSYRRLKQEASKYKTKKEFREKSGKAWQVAAKKPYYDEITAHMELIKKPNNYWTEKMVFLEAKKYETRMEFKKKCSSGYSKAQSLGIIDRVCSHMEKGASCLE